MTTKSSAELLAQAIAIVEHPFSTTEDRRTAVQVAYDLGKADGKVEGGRAMGELLTTSVAKALA